MKVEPEDFEWRTGKKLQKYEVLDEVPGDEKTKQIRVQLTIVGAAPQTATYHVVGRGPIAVIRDKDFNRMSGM